MGSEIERELALQFEGRKMRVDVGHLVTRLERRVRRLLPWRLRSGVGAVGQACCNAHDDGAVIARLRTEAGRVALKQNGGVALRIAQRRFEAEQAVGVACAR